jgi:tRNA(Ile)-lysidine synthase TilS/MesJ
MKFCTSCVLSDTFPGIEFDKDGKCNYCRHIQVPDELKKREYTKKFEDLLDSVRGKYDYDVIMAFSGGKDSTYTMYQLANKYKMNILALTFDNGFISEKARENIIRMTDLCGATSFIIRPSFNKMKKIFQIAATKDLYNIKTLDRASSICTTCIGHVKSLMLKTALEKNIPLAAYGWSPGQAPITSAIMQTNPRLQSFSHKTVRDPILQHSKELTPYFLSEKELNIDKEKWPINIHPLAFMEYDEEDILKFIKSLGWEQPLDTDPNSSNCVLNALANYLHRKKFHFHPYAWEIAGIVRDGGIPRDEGIAKITKDEDVSMVKYAADLLEINIK